MGKSETIHFNFTYSNFLSGIMMQSHNNGVTTVWTLKCPEWHCRHQVWLPNVSHTSYVQGSHWQGDSTMYELVRVSPWLLRVSCISRFCGLWIYSLNQKWAGIPSAGKGQEEKAGTNWAGWQRPYKLAAGTQELTTKYSELSKKMTLVNRNERSLGE